MIVSQVKTNPFLFSDTNKRYHTYEYYLRHRYGEKCAKITLDAGLTCPNIDGKCGIGGCIYCSSKGSGDFTAGATRSITEQYALQRQKISSKWQCRYFIPYLQAHTNTYAPLEVLRPLYGEVLSLPDAVAVHIATRADCLPDGVVRLLAEIAEQTELTVELGLQSVNDETARRINRGHTYEAFKDGFKSLREASSKIRIAVHLINGLPGEDTAMMVESAKTVAALFPDEIKLHLLHVLRGTVLGVLFEDDAYTPMTEDAYIDTLIRQLEVIPGKTVIGRVTGDGDARALLAPLWSLRKVCVINHLDKELYARQTYQGRLCIAESI